MYPYYYVYPFRQTQKNAYAEIKGGPLAPSLKGIILFFNHPYGTEIYVEVSGLPPFQPATKNSPQIGPHGFHIHEFGTCQIGERENPFQAAGKHWNPTNQPHGNHAGDFPVLFSNDGYSQMRFFTNKFNVTDSIGKSIIIHQSPDDFKSQLAGNSGKRLGCGIIMELP